MRVQNMTSSKGNKVANQFIIYGTKEESGSIYNALYFQSYDSIIACKCHGRIYLDENAWDYSVTTGKYRNLFLGETKKETEQKIKSGEYLLANLN